MRRNRDEIFKDLQLAKAVYLRHMSAMKEILNLGEMKFGDRSSEPYKYYKKVVMDEFYTAMSDVFEALEKEGLLRRCDCGTSIRGGYKPCGQCNGASFCNTDDFNSMLATDECEDENEDEAPDEDVTEIDLD